LYKVRKKDFGKKVTTIQASYKELEELARETYGLTEYSFIATQECGNDSLHKFKVTDDLTHESNADINSIRAGNYVPDYGSDLLLKVLCADGYIEAGDYIINVSW
jgi:hypothetical protein